MPGVIADAGQTGDDRRDARQRPQVGGEAVGLGAAPQGPVDLGQLLPLQPWLAPGAPGGFEPGSALGLPGPIPAAGRHGRDVQRPGDGGLRLATREQPRGLKPACFQRVEVPAGTTRSRHHSAWHRSP